MEGRAPGSPTETHHGKFSLHFQEALGPSQFPVPVCDDGFPTPTSLALRPGVKVHELSAAAAGARAGVGEGAPTVTE